VYCALLRLAYGVPQIWFQFTAACTICLSVFWQDLQGRVAMAAAGVRGLQSCLAGKDHVCATDAQTHLLNWLVRGRRGTVPLLPMSTVHSGTPFIVASKADCHPEVSVEDADEAM
jgi:hypothetical protein